jgi:L-ascorbate metabolism protein UlaG (beta-lactamase superfamily)
VPAGHLDPERAAEALRLLQPSLVVPVHWGTFRTPRAPEPSREVAEAFLAAAAEAAPQVEVRVLEIGETLEL